MDSNITLKITTTHRQALLLDFIAICTMMESQSMTHHAYNEQHGKPSSKARSWTPIKLCPDIRRELT